MGGNNPGERGQRYMFDGGDEDLKRLLRIADMTAEASATALRRSGIAPGWNVIECGCGPLGALHVLADLVGETGRVAGVDLNPEAVERARTVADTLGLGNVRVSVGNVNDAEPGALGGPFDLAYTRLFLIHQADPVKTLRRIAGLLRPGGWIIAQEPLRQPPPQAFPHSAELEAAWQLFFELAKGLGAQPHATETLPRSVAAAGLELVRADGMFTIEPPDRVFPVFASTVAATREGAAAAGLATKERIDALTAALHAAAQEDYEWAIPAFMIDFTIRKP